MEEFRDEFLFACKSGNARKITEILNDEAIRSELLSGRHDTTLGMKIPNMRKFPNEAECLPALLENPVYQARIATGKLDEYLVKAFSGMVNDDMIKVLFATPAVRGRAASGVFNEKIISKLWGAAIH